MKFKRLLLVSVFGLGLALLLMGLLGRPPDTAHARERTLYVSQKFGSDFANDCADPAHPCRTIQYAVDRAIEYGEVRVSDGTYDDIHQRSGITQVVYIDQTVIVRGGYNFNFTKWNPEKLLTILDAGGQGSVIYILGVTPTLEGLRITNGVNQFGGGVQVHFAHPIINGCWIYSNTATNHGGGIYLYHSAGAALGGNHIYSNTANHIGGGVHLDDSDDATLTGNHVYSNTAGAHSGGLFISGEGVTLTGNVIYQNRADSEVSGVDIYQSVDVTLTDNHVYGNPGGGILLLESEHTTLIENQIYQNVITGSGGGIRVEESPNTTLTGNHVYSNTATGSGGGIFLYKSDDATLTGNVISNNKAELGGGIRSLYVHTATLTGNQVFSNTADGGGGIYLRSGSNITLTDNQIYSNTAGIVGGGIYLRSVRTTLTNNVIRNNAAQSRGGGVRIYQARPVTLTGNSIISNTASNGGGAHFDFSVATLVNNIVAGNQITGAGAGLFLGEVRIDLLHTTLARNSGGDGSGICISGPGIVTSTNTILVGHTRGITVAEGSTVTMEATLWGDGVWGNDTDWSGGGAIVTGAINIWGDPAFVAPAKGDYHIGFGSAAAGAGIDVGVTTDIDGDARPAPAGTLPDLGADEVSQRRVYLPLALRDF